MAATPGATIDYWDRIFQKLFVGTTTQGNTQPKDLVRVSYAWSNRKRLGQRQALRN